MKTKLPFLLILFQLFSNQSFSFCSEPNYNGTTNGITLSCDAGFVFAPIQGDTVYFNNTSTGDFDSVFWSFGDGSYSSEYSPMHVFDFLADSIYEVCLTITSDSCQDTYCSYVYNMDTITPTEPVCDASFYIQAYGDTVYFNNTSTGDFDSIFWGFGDGSYSSEYSPMHVFDFLSDSIYEVCLTITSDSCQDTYCSYVYNMDTITPTEPVCDASFYIQAQGDTVYFNNTSTGDFDSVFWSFGDGSYSSEYSPMHVFDFLSDSIYEVCLTITSDSCQDTYCNYVYNMDTITPIEPFCDASFYIQAQGDTVYFNNTSSGDFDSVFWSFGDGSYSSEYSPMHVFDFVADSIYEVCLTITSDSCQGTYCNYVYDMDTITPTEPVCDASFYIQAQGDTVYFNNTSTGDFDSIFWSFGDGSYSSEYSPMHVFDFLADSIYEVCLTITSDSCQDTYCSYVYNMDTITPIEPVCDASFYIQAQGDTVYFNNTSTGDFDSIFWSFGDGSYSSEYSPMHVFDFLSDSIYEVCLTITSDSCQDTYCNYVYNMDTITPTEPFCDASFYIQAQGDTVYFNNTSTGDFDSVFWSFGDGSYSSEYSPMHIFDFASDSIYEVCLTVLSDSCMDTYCDVVKYKTSCQVYFSNYPDTGNTIRFNGYSYSQSMVKSWSWDFDDGTFSNEKSPVHTFNTSNKDQFNVCVTIKTFDNCMATYCSNIGLSCRADFNFRKSTEFDNVVAFNDISVGNINNWYWDFGDGRYSYEQNPIHSFADAVDSVAVGEISFNVCLTVSDYTNNCTNKTCYVVNFNDSTYTVSGTVTAGGANLDNGFAVLYQQIDSLSFDAKDAVIIENGYYQFNGVEQGEYILHAIPNLTAESNYLPTYYINALSWKNADIFTVNSSITGVDINLRNKRSILNGIGNVEGKILSNLESNQLISNVPVVLIDGEGNELAFVIPDASGYFEFNNLNYGTYYLYPETPNAENIEKVKVIISPENYSVKNLQVVFNEMVTHSLSQNILEPSIRYNSNQEIIIEIADNMFDRVEIYNVVGQNLTNKVGVSIDGDNVRVRTERLLNGVYIINLIDRKSGSRNSLKFMK